jgi:hypothetical protein
VADQRRDPPTQHRKLGPSLGLLVRCGCGQQLGYAPFTSLAEAGQVLRRTDTCGSWNPWDTNYPHQGPHEGDGDLAELPNCRDTSILLNAYDRGCGRSRWTFDQSCPTSWSWATTWGVISSMHHPEHFRRVEKLEYVDADLGRRHLEQDVFYLEAAKMGPVIAWCHGIAGPLILPAGDVHIWRDVPEDRRTSDERDVYWGVLSGGAEPLFTFSRLPDQTDTWQQHRIQEQQAFWQRDQPK